MAPIPDPRARMRSRSESVAAPGSERVDRRARSHRVRKRRPRRLSFGVLSRIGSTLGEGDDVIDSFGELENHDGSDHEDLGRSARFAGTTPG